MPIYEYRRPDGTTFELQQSFSDESLTVDPETGVPVERVLHAPAVHFKGKGFYNTDYGTRKRQRETAAHAESSSSKESSSKDSSKDSGSKDSSSSKESSSSSGDSASSSGSSKGGSSKGDSGKAKSAAAAKSD
jgi:putative FmdB family regulatory protein